MVIVWLVVGLVILVWGAELLVKGASRLAAAFGIAPLIIGLTVVAFGTSAPEMAVSVMSGMKGQADLAVGNVVGSNIFNVLFILGLAALITPLAVSRQLIRLDVPLMIAASLVVVVMALDGGISRVEGALLFAGIVGYTVFLIIKARRDKQAASAVDDEFAREFGEPAKPGWQGYAINGGLIAIG
nr:sodium:calcium antiporter [Corallincola sp.]